MLFGLFYRFYHYIAIQWLCVLLAKIAYLPFRLRNWFWVQQCRKEVVSMPHEQALDTVNQIHPCPNVIIECKSCPVDEKLDLSIIVPVYNYAELLPANIDSILNQKTQYTFELILVDDGSTDGSSDILRRYQHIENVRIVSKENGGIASARNAGLNVAHGKFIMFVDCDDTVENNIVEVLLERAYATDADIVMCGHNLVKWKEGKIASVIPNLQPSANLLEYAPDAMILNYAGLPWCKVYRRELWKNVRFFSGFWYEDCIIHSLLFTQCRHFAYVPQICYQYRWYEKNFSHTQSKSTNPKCIDYYWLLMKCLEQCKSLGLSRGVRFETMLLRHLTSYFYPKVAALPEDVIKALFILACDLYQQYGSMNERLQLPGYLKKAREILIERDFAGWKLISQTQP